MRSARALAGGDRTTSCATSCCRCCRICAACRNASTASSALAGRGELRIRTVADEDSRRILRTLVNRALLGGIGAAVLAVSAVLLVAADPGPAIGEDTGLFEVFGYGGLLAGTVLVLRVVAAVARDGTT